MKDYEEIEVMSIDHPFMEDFKSAINAELKNAIYFAKDGTTAIITAKVTVNASPDGPEFENDAKLLDPIEYSVGLTTKHDFEKRKGFSIPILARLDGNSIYLIDPDNQIQLDL